MRASCSSSAQDTWAQLCLDILPFTHNNTGAHRRTMLHPCTCMHRILKDVVLGVIVGVNLTGAQRVTILVRDGTTRKMSDGIYFLLSHLSRVSSDQNTSSSPMNWDQVGISWTFEKGGRGFMCVCFGSGADEQEGRGARPAGGQCCTCERSWRQIWV